MRPFAIISPNRRFASVLLIICVGVGLALMTGCATTWPPTREHLRLADATTISSLADFCPPPGTRKVFRRTERGQHVEDAERYEVVVQSNGRFEGLLCDRINQPLGSYLTSDVDGATPRRFNWPDARGQSHAAFFMRFEPALGCTPNRVVGGSELVCESGVQMFNWQGRPNYKGRVGRHLYFEGFDRVQIGQIEYDDCLLLRAEMHFRFPWIGRVDTTEFIWLARGIGEVRRLARWRGFVFLAFFDEMSRYELVEYHPGDVKSSPGETHSAAAEGAADGYLRAWRQCAVFLQPALPRPQLAGLLVE